MPLLKESGMVSGLSRLSWQMLRSQKEIKQVTRFSTGPSLLAKPLAKQSDCQKKCVFEHCEKRVVDKQCVCVVCVCVLYVCVLYVCECCVLCVLCIVTGR